MHSQCGRCGNDCPEGARFCARCGESLIAPSMVANATVPSVMGTTTAAPPVSKPPPPSLIQISFPASARTDLRVIESCYTPDQLVTAPNGMRLGAWLIDMVLICLTLGIGWLVWFCVTSRTSQTPAKRMFHLYIIRADGTRAGAGYTQVREIVLKGVFGIVGVFTIGTVPAIAAAWCLWDSEQQCLWDKLGRTFVAQSPSGFVPMSAKELRTQGASPLTLS